MQSAAGQRPVRRGGAPRVDDDQPAGLRRCRQVPDERRHRLGDVAPDQQDRLRRRQIGDRERQSAIEPERADPRRGGGRHAEPPVVVDVRRAERDAGELAEHVRLLVGEPAAAEDPHRVPTPDLLRGAEAVGDPVEGVVPRRRLQPPGDPDQGRGEPVGVAQQFGARPPLLAQAAAVGRELTGRDGRPGCAVGGERHRALQAAVGTVGVDPSGDDGRGHDATAIDCPAPSFAADVRRTNTIQVTTAHTM